jgi:hypothetical protein
VPDESVIDSLTAVRKPPMQLWHLDFGDGLEQFEARDLKDAIRHAEDRAADYGTALLFSGPIGNGARLLAVVGF